MQNPNKNRTPVWSRSDIAEATAAAEFEKLVAQLPRDPRALTAIADLAGVSSQTLQAWVAGGVTEPKFRTVKAVAHAVGYPLKNAGHVARPRLTLVE